VSASRRPRTDRASRPEGTWSAGPGFAGASWLASRWRKPFAWALIRLDGAGNRDDGHAVGRGLGSPGCGTGLRVTAPVRRAAGRRHQGTSSASSRATGRPAARLPRRRRTGGPNGRRVMTIAPGAAARTAHGPARGDCLPARSFAEHPAARAAAGGGGGGSLFHFSPSSFFWGRCASRCTCRRGGSARPRGDDDRGVELPESGRDHVLHRERGIRGESKLPVRGRGRCPGRRGIRVPGICAGCEPGEGGWECGSGRCGRVGSISTSRRPGRRRL